MKRTKRPEPVTADQLQAQALTEFLAALDRPREMIRPGLEALATEYGLNPLEIILTMIVESQDGAATANERELVRLLTPPLVFTVRRLSGESADTAKRKLLRELGVVPMPNAPTSSVVQ